MRGIKIASPLFIVREDAQRDLYGTLERLARAGFEGVELLSLFGRPAQEIRARLDALGMVAIGDHVPLGDLLAEPERVLAQYQVLGCDYLTIAWPDRAIDSRHADFAATLEKLGRAAACVAQAGMTPLYHNHDFEIADDAWIPALFAACAPHGLRFEPDLGWMATTGKDPAAYLRDYGHLSPVLHFKDICAGMAAGEGEPGGAHFVFRPTGYGTVNFPALMPLSLACAPAWIVADHDYAYGRDAYDELALSAQYIRALLALYV